MLWAVHIDGSLRSLGTARQGSTKGIRLTDGQAANGVDVVIQALDGPGNIVAATGPAY